MHSLGIVQWNSTRRDHPGNPRGVSGSGLVTTSLLQGVDSFLNGEDCKLLHFSEEKSKEKTCFSNHTCFSRR